MRELKLVIWDLDETLIRGVFVEGDREVRPLGTELLQRLDDRGVLQGLATQNEPDVAEAAVSHFEWGRFFQLVRSDFGPKHTKVLAILEELEVSAADAVFVDEDRFERDLMGVQVPGLTAWSMAELQGHVDGLDDPVTEEARRRPEMYRALRRKRSDEEVAEDLETFLAGCDISVNVREYRRSDRERAVELLTRTNRMNLGTDLAPEEVIADAPGSPSARVVVAELSDRYGDSGRCGIVRVETDDAGADITSIAISCRARARGLSLAILVGMLRHPAAHHESCRCVYRSTGRNRPLRMLLWAAGFQATERSDELRVDRKTLDDVRLPDWVSVSYEPALAPRGAENAVRSIEGGP